MQILSDNWTSVKICFDTIKFVHFYSKNHYESVETVMYELDKNATPREISNFFRKVATLVYSKKARQIIDSDKEHYQFVMSNSEYKSFPVKWFDLVFDNGIKISHDIAFNTTYIKKNDFDVPFGQSPNFKKRNKYPIYRELRMKKNAYNFIANQALK